MVSMKRVACAITGDWPDFRELVRCFCVTEVPVLALFAIVKESKDSSSAVGFHKAASPLTAKKEL